MKFTPKKNLSYLIELLYLKHCSFKLFHNN